MSRGQEKQAFETATGEEGTLAGESSQAFGGASSAIKNYQEALSKFMSANPFAKGGEYDRTILPKLTQTSDSVANSLRGALQSTAARTGENSASSAATAAEAARQGERDLAGQVADAEQKRIEGEAGYNEQGVKLSAEPIQAEEGLYGTSTGNTIGAINAMTGAGKTPGFFDELGASFAQGLGGGFGKALS